MYVQLYPSAAGPVGVELVGAGVLVEGAVVAFVGEGATVAFVGAGAGVAGRS